MNDLPRQKLCEIITQFGHSLSEDLGCCEGVTRILKITVKTKNPKKESNQI